MNKQELIKKMQEQIKEIDIELSNPRCDSDDAFVASIKKRCWGKAIHYAKRLDEPQKVKVPAYVGELLDYYRKSTDVDLLALLICFKDWYFRNDKTSENEEAIDWLVKHPEKFMKAWLDGYEVEEEPKYYIQLPSTTWGTYLVKSDDNDLLVWQNTRQGTPFTEQEIKAIDERYWPFAVPAEKV